MNLGHRAVLILLAGAFFTAQPVLAATPSQLNSDVDSIMRLVRANKDGSNNQTIDDKINSLTMDEKIAIIGPLHAKVQDAQRQLAQTEKQLNQTNELTLENLRSIRNFATYVAAELLGLTAIAQTVELSFMMPHIRRTLENANSPVGRQKFSKEEIDHLKSLSNIKDGKLVPSYSKILSARARQIWKASYMFDDTLSNSKAFGIVGIVATAAALGAEAGVVMLPESVGDQDLLKNRDRIKGDIATLRALVDSISLHLDVFQAKFKMEKN
jgi:hypothetical protein